MIDKFELGIIYDKNGKLKNHRSLIKVFVNPFLRLFGYNIATKADGETEKLLGPVLVPCKKRKNINFLYDNEDFYTIVKRRIIL